MNSNELFEEKIACSVSFGGANFYYGLRMRPFSLGAQPKDTSIYLDNELASFKFANAKDPINFRHGVVGYANELTPEEVKRFELIPLDIDSGSEFRVNINTVELTTESIALFVVERMIKEAFSASKLTWTMYEKWVADIQSAGVKSMNKWFRYHPAVINRKEDAERFKAFSDLSKTITIEDFNNAIVDNFLC